MEPKESVSMLYVWSPLTDSPSQQRLGNESMRQFDACALCLNKARQPLACNEGHLFCKECVYTDLRMYLPICRGTPQPTLPVTQKKDIKRQKEKLEALKREAEAEKQKAKEAARDRVLLEFEKGQRSLGSAGTALTTSGELSQDGMWTFAPRNVSY